jgi:hypothetical protein
LALVIRRVDLVIDDSRCGVVVLLGRSASRSGKPWIVHSTSGASANFQLARHVDGLAEVRDELGEGQVERVEADPERPRLVKVIPDDSALVAFGACSSCQQSRQAYPTWPTVGWSP